MEVEGIAFGYPGLMDMRIKQIRFIEPGRTCDSVKSWGIRLAGLPLGRPPKDKAVYKAILQESLSKHRSIIQQYERYWQKFDLVNCWLDDTPTEVG